MEVNMIKGAIVALITPFNDEGEVNYNKIRELINWHIEQGTDGILVLGTTGETPALTEEEQEKIVEIAIEESRGRVPIIANSGSYNTTKSLEKSKKYEEMGADGLLVITPYYNKPNASGMLEHFHKIADGVSTPIYIYNVPSRTGSCISFEVVKELAKHKNIVGIKEASGDISYAAKLSTLIKEDFNIYSGNDDITIALMSMGGAGAVSVWANLMPAEVHQMATDYLEGKIEKARKTQLQYLNLINALFCETNPVPIKEIMNMAGMDVGGCRLPLGPISSANRKVLAGLL
ncbi:MAG: 4-hydroxy-tetrahydrodipicolinate synthase [Clostridiales bacterium]|nr:4-hydroxy-tetrahydrodipicolinate synthase [Clostridiales bacterium]